MSRVSRSGLGGQNQKSPVSLMQALASPVCMMLLTDEACAPAEKTPRVLSACVLSLCFSSPIVSMRVSCCRSIRLTFACDVLPGEVNNLFSLTWAGAYWEAPL